jgi:glutamate synthase domain-containing protein 2
MTLQRPNASLATGTKNRIPDVAPMSGICSVCLDGCPGACEVWTSSLRGREVIYPLPFGKITSGATKDYPVDYSHLNIQGTCVGAVGIEATPDKAVFPNVDVSVEFGGKHGKIKQKLPIFTGALGSTAIARNNWEHFAVGTAIAGVSLVCGENVCGMDPNSEIKKGRVVRSPDMERRVKAYREFHEGYGTIIVQHNIEDGRLGVPEYVVEKLGVEAIEIKWGQGAKDIGGEVKLPAIERAKQLKDRGYVVAPDPDDPAVKQAFKAGALKEFERHSRPGMIDEYEFYKRVEYLRSIGAKYVSLKTGAYRAADLARAVKFASEAELDLLTIDGAGGGTGMSPWRMMNEWGIPTIYIESLAYNMLKKLADKGKYIPPVAIAGGFSLEDHIFKAIALGSPYVKMVCMGRALMIPGMVGKNIDKWIKEGKLPPSVAKYGTTVEQIYILAAELKTKYGKDFERLPLGAIGMYHYADRLTTGLRQLLAGARKFTLKSISRDDLVALTREAAEITGIPYVMEHDLEKVEKILGV